MMNQEIKTRENLEFLFKEFYKTATKDLEIGHHFDDLDLESHLPVIVDFWEKVLFGKQVYFNNPLVVHQMLHDKNPLKPEHFRRWIEIFSATIDKFFDGETAENAKLRAQLIARSLNQNLNGKDFVSLKLV